MRMQRSSGADEYIRFGDGDDLGLEIRTDHLLGRDGFFASELVISGLRGIDFPVKLFGSRTEGKNVGMEVQEYKYGNSILRICSDYFPFVQCKGLGGLCRRN